MRQRNAHHRAILGWTRLFCRWLIVFCCVLCGVVVSAQDITYPTVDALNTVILPPNDPIDLARRLRSIDVQYTPPNQPPDWQIGDTRFFNVVDASTRQELAFRAQLRGMSENVLLWIDASAPISNRIAQQFVKLVDTAIYRQAQDLWGFVEPDGVDGDPRLYILVASDLGSAIAGYFADINAYPRSVQPNSNQHEMIIVNLAAWGNTNILSPSVLSVIAHEYQHLLRFFIDSNEGTWLDEAFSMVTEHHIGWDNNRSQVVSFLNHPNVQLNQWVADDSRYSRYGGVFLFVNYFVEQFGLDALRLLSNEQSDGWQGVDAVLHQIGARSADDFFADWVLANYFLDVGTGYGYETLWNDLPSAYPIAMITNYPYQLTGRLPQYSTDYYVAFRMGDAEALTLTFTQPDHARLIPTNAYDGDYIYYSVPADNSDTTLTRRFDLSGVDSATLTFQTWYDLEERWDYAYVMASTDDGMTWDILSGTTSRTDNPYNRAYGEGYTGKSFGWVQETVSLDAYAGGEVLIRFEVISDAASIRHGFAIDGLHIDAIGYQDSFEDDSDEWDAQGWIRTDNRLPQRTWLQVVQQVEKDLTLSRWLIETDTSQTVELVDNAELVLIAVSPIAPQTMVDTTYSLDVAINQ